MKIMAIIGTRPEIIKLSRVLAELQRHVEVIIAHTGQNYDYELNEVFFEDLDMRRPDHFLECAGATAAATIGNVIAHTDALFAAEQPDGLLLYGDTNSCLAVIAAKRRKIPIFHMEAGNRSFDQRVPEEINRKIVDHLSDINMPLTEHARKYLLAEGLRPETVIKTGSPMKEILMHHLTEIEASDVLERHGLTPGEFFIVSTHREENIDSEKNFGDLLESLNAIAEEWDHPIIVATHPRTRQRLEVLGRTDIHERVRFQPAMGFFDYFKLQMNATCVISDSGTVTEESSILNFPAITVRQTHERPEGMDEGVLVMSGLESAMVVRSIKMVVEQASRADRVTRIVEDYNVDNYSIKVSRIVLSYVDYVNRYCWHKF